MTFIFILLGFLPSFAWLFFFLKEDVHPEPKKLLTIVFFFGAVATIVATFIQYYIRDVLWSYDINQYQFIAFLLFAAVEEILKFSVAYLAVRRSKYFDEPIDAMIYMITASLGFALVENVAILLNTNALLPALGVVTMRFVGATLLHALSSGLVGYYWAKSIVRHEGHKISPTLIWGLALASVLHAIFNYLIITFGDALVYPTIFLIIISLFVFWDFEKIKKERPLIHE